MPIADLDDDQKTAATLSGNEVVVSAGAGSGKTRLLVGRYLYLVAALHTPPREIAAITFTNKAANQMKARIADRASGLAARYPELSDLWREISEHIHDAPVSTIHAFCNAILRAHPVEAGVDPLFEVLDETALAGLRSDTLDRFIALRMEEDPARMESLAGVFGLGGLRSILGILLDERPRMARYFDSDSLPDLKTLEARYRGFILDRLNTYLVMARQFHTLRPDDDALSDVVAGLVPALREIRDAVEADRIDPSLLNLAVGTAWSGLGRKGSQKKWGERGFDIGRVRGSLKECLGFVEHVAAFNACEREVVLPAVASLLDEYVRLERFFLTVKKERSAIDNDDSLVETWRLLRRDPAVRRKVSAGFSHLLVDEFQDTDGLQFDILTMITGDSGAKLFTVGDPKQSIYRFRGADVSVFNDFACRAEFKPLRTTYRSSPGIVAFVNRVFSRVMGVEDREHPSEVGYSEMKPHRKTGNGGPGVEIVITEGDSADSRRIAEGEFIAQRVKELTETGIPFGRMALLLRKGTQSRRYEEAFLRAGIPFVNLAGGNPFESPEALDIGNLLGWLADPSDEALFTGLLLSPFFMAGADLLYELRREAGRHGSMPALFLAGGGGIMSGSDGASRIRATLRGLIDRRDRFSIRELLEYAFSETGYTAAIIADPVRGEESLAVVDAVLDAADGFERSGGTASEFGELLRKGGLASERGATLETRGDALTIITIHKAKGLEYKAVFLADAASKPKGDTCTFLLHDALGPAVTYRSPTGKRVESFALSLARENEKKKAIAESKRLFYVACTRAEDILVITGGPPPKEPDDRFETDNWMGWLYSALDIDREHGPMNDETRGLFSFSRIEGGAGPAETASAFWRPFVDGPADTGDSLPDLPAGLVPSPLEISGKPATLSPTQVMDYLACPARYLLNRLYRLSASSDRMGERYGELAHHALEKWDYHDRAALVGNVDRFAGHSIPADLHGRLRESLAAFASSDLAREVAGSDEIRREERFGFIEEDVLVRGAIDLVARTPDGWIVVDFKTNHVAPENVPAEAERYLIQLGLYALALHRAEDIVPARLAVHFLALGITHSFPCDRDVIDGVAYTLHEVIAAMDAGDFKPRPSWECERCPGKKVCGVGKTI